MLSRSTQRLSSALRFSAHATTRQTSEIYVARHNHNFKILSRATPVARKAIRPFHTSQSLQGIIPDSENPPPKESQPHDQVTAPANITEEEYHQRADELLEIIQSRLERLQETRTDIEIEFANGVLNIEVRSQGEYVINKQPPNKQIWLSSPISGPKRYDWVVLGEAMNQKEGGGRGDWIYLRDGSSLDTLLKTEIGVESALDEEIS